MIRIDPRRVTRNPACLDYRRHTAKILISRRLIIKKKWGDTVKLKKIVHERTRESGATFFYVGRTALRQMNLARGEDDALHFRGFYYDIPGHSDFYGGFTSLSAAVADCYERFCKGSRPSVRNSQLRAAAGLPPTTRTDRGASDRRSLPNVVNAA